MEDTAFFWLHEDTNTDVLSLGIVFDKLNVPGGVSGSTMNLTTAGMPAEPATSISAEEDPGNMVGGPGGLINGTETWSWNDHNTDGAMVSGLENLT